MKCACFRLILTMLSTSLFEWFSLKACYRTRSQFINNYINQLMLLLTLLQNFIFAVNHLLYFQIGSYSYDIIVCHCLASFQVVGLPPWA